MNITINKNIGNSRDFEVVVSYTSNISEGTLVEIGLAVKTISRNIRVNTNGNSYDIGILRDRESREIVIDDYVRKSEINLDYDGATPKMNVSYR